MRKFFYLTIILFIGLTSALILSSCDNAEKITITFDSRGGSFVEPISAKAGSEISELPTPTRDGYTFDSWWYDYGEGSYQYWLKPMPESDITLFAKWVTANGAVSTIEQLKSITTSGNYYLVNDIDLGGEEWEIKDGYDTPFTGLLDGKGYKISNFTITNQGSVMRWNQSTFFYTGLFSYNKGVIKNLGITDFNYEYSYTDNVCYYGGIAAYNEGVISNCYSVGNIKAVSGGELVVGGIAGLNEGIISGCYSSGQYDINTSQVMSLLYLGGVAGSFREGIISNSYSASNLTGRAARDGLNACGGLVGHVSNGTITNCFATGDISFYGNNIGGLAGLNYENNSYIFNCYEPEGQSLTKINYNGGTENSAPNGLAAITDKSNFESVNWVKNLWHYDADMWDLEYGRLPILSADSKSTIDTVLYLSTPEELKKINGSIRKYKLTANLNLNYDEWDPLVFIGDFDGDGYIIKKLQITAPTPEAGLFGVNGGTIRNLGIEGYHINIDKHAVSYIGALVGRNIGVIKNTYAIDGSIQAEGANSGGLVGGNEGSIIKSFASGSIFLGEDTSSCAGGLVGYNVSGIIENSFATTAVTGRSVGGLVAINSYRGKTGSITNSYNTYEQYINGLYQYSGTDVRVISADSLFNISFITQTLHFGNYNSLNSFDELKNSPDYVWIIENGLLPKLYRAK